MNLRWTELMLTSDGGKTWKKADGAPDALNAEMLLVSLMSTTDGGATWKTLTPGPQPHVIQPHGN